MTSFREAFPILTVEDVDRAADFYCSTFGFSRGFSFEEAGTTAFVFLELEPLGVGLARRGAEDDPDFALWLYTDDVDAAAERLRAAGAEGGAAADRPGVGRATHDVPELRRPPAAHRAARPDCAMLVGSIQLDAVLDAVGPLAASGSVPGGHGGGMGAVSRALSRARLRRPSGACRAGAFVVRRRADDARRHEPRAAGALGMEDGARGRVARRRSARSRSRRTRSTSSSSTHMHIDHVGWNTDARGRRALPAARATSSIRTDGVRERAGRAAARQAVHPRARWIASSRREGTSSSRQESPPSRLPGPLPGPSGVRDRVGRSAGADLIADAAVHPALLDEPEWVYVSDGVPDTCAATRLAVVPTLVDRRRPRRLRPLPGQRHRPSRHA